MQRVKLLRHRKQNFIISFNFHLEWPEGLFMVLLWIKFHITHENKRLLFSSSAFAKGEGLGKLHIKVLLTQGYAGEKLRFSMLGP